MARPDAGYPALPSHFAELAIIFREANLALQHTRHDELGDRHFMTVGIAERAATRQVFGFQKFVTRKRHLIEFEVGGGRPIALDPATDHRIGLDDQLSEPFERFVFRPNLDTPIRGELFPKPFGARLGHPAGQKNGQLFTHRPTP